MCKPFSIYILLCHLLKNNTENHRPILSSLCLIKPDICRVSAFTSDRPIASWVKGGTPPPPRMRKTLTHTYYLLNDNKIKETNKII